MSCNADRTRKWLSTAVPAGNSQGNIRICAYSDIREPDLETVISVPVRGSWFTVLLSPVVYISYLLLSTNIIHWSYCRNRLVVKQAQQGSPANQRGDEYGISL